MFKLKLKEIRLSMRAKILLAVLTLSFSIGGALIAYRFYDFTQNNPKFCVSCHLMQPAFDAWEASVHKGINCHDCHHLSIPEQNKLLITFVLHNPDKVPPRHGKVIVPWKYCIKCHWEKSDKHPDAPPVNRSALHAKHYFMEQIECSRCHGYRVHEFVPEERFCINCHEGKEVHGTGMETLACLNCHTDRTVDLRPGRDKCLFCHGSDEVRKTLIEQGSMDVRYFQPTPGAVKNTLKIDAPPGAPMQFYCYECHKPHAKARPDWGGCMNCHKTIKSAGKHALHIDTMAMTCKQCHRPHGWRVTPKTAQKDCTTCHDYKSPESFL